MMKLKHFGLAIAFVGVSSLAGAAQAINLSDLVKQTPQLYLPSQILPGEDAVFTVKGKPGQQVNLILSSDSGDKVLPSGVHIPIGEPTISQAAVIPASGVATIVLKIPKDVSDSQFVEAVVSSNADQSDAKPAQIMNSSGQPASQNIVAVGTPPDKGHTLIIPGGDPTMTNLLRSVSTINDIGQDPRKKDLIYTGDINRDRPLDQNLNLGTPSP